MVDFSDQIGGESSKQPTDPSEIYDNLDRASDKGPLRPSQEKVLEQWYQDRRNDKDVVVKLHTGQGKTLVGLLILQSRLNAGEGPSLYLCPNKFLVSQTCMQAEEFGVEYCTEDNGELPISFLEGDSILITSVQKLFNGMTKFGIGAKSEDVGAVVMDDAHACIDAIRSATKIKAESGNGLYEEILDLFSEHLENQGAGTFADIKNGDGNSFLKVPYWAWYDNEKEITKIISKYNKKERKEVIFTWPILRDNLKHCRCVVSGEHVEIEPYRPPIQEFGSYHNAKCRVFMSAKMAEDSFLVKGLRVSREAIENPITYESPTWSGERMVIIPSMIDSSLSRGKIVKLLGESDKDRGYGVSVITPSFSRTEDWEQYGSEVPGSDSIEEKVNRLKNGKYKKTVVFANRYDGIDLPDNSCRILVIDSSPYAHNLIDRYEEECRPDSDIVLGRTARKIEQGLGRSVRGERDYCVVMLTGPDLVRNLRLEDTRKHLSSQTRRQIEIGLEIASLAADDAEEADAPEDVLEELVSQCLNRDDGWKRFYDKKMEDIESDEIDTGVLDQFTMEREAEKAFQDGDINGAKNKVQNYIDENVNNETEKGWYLQRMARYIYESSKDRSNEIQKAAHSKNRYVLKPRMGVEVERIKVNQNRAEKISDWLGKHDTFSEMRIELEDILDRLEFGIDSERFEEAINEVAEALGFESERPEKEWGEGPDNLWAMGVGKYAVIECKNEVDKNRSKINASETEQMNKSCAWFDDNYDTQDVTRIIIHPAYVLDNKAALTHEDVRIITEPNLRRLKDKIESFFMEWSGIEIGTETNTRIQKLLKDNNLDRENIFSDVVRKYKNF